MTAGGAARMWPDGTVIGRRYRVERLAGRGGMGEVYQVRHQQWGIDLAAKVPRGDGPPVPVELQEFEDEAQIWVSLGLHPNICCCHFVRRFDGVPVVFAEYVAGGSLRQWITDRWLYQGSTAEALCRVLDVAVQFAWGLDYAHQRHVIHQDVKPANVLIDRSGGDITVKVTDFGLARARVGTSVPASGHGSGNDDRSAASTLVSGLGMTPAYASPEQENGEMLSRRTDVYSYAVSVLEMFTGQRPRQTGGTAGGDLTAYRADNSSRPGIPSMPAALSDLLERCLHPDPAERPATMAEIAAEIAGIYQEVSGSAFPRTMPKAADLPADELNNQALSLLDLGSEAEARETFARALAADPQNLPARYNAGLLRWRRGDVTDLDFVAEIEAMRADGGDPAVARQLLAQAHLERGDLSAARALVVEAEAASEPAGLALGALETGMIVDACCTDEWKVAWPAYTDLETVQRTDPHTSEIARGAILGMPVNPNKPHRITRRDDAALSLTPDGRLAVTGTWDGTVRLWDVRTGHCLKTLHGHRQQIDAVDVTPDGRFALSADESGVICFWDLTGQRPKCRRKITDPARVGMHLARISLSHDGRVAFWAGAEGRIRVLDTGSGKLWHSPERHSAGARSVLVGPRQRWALSSGWEIGAFKNRDDTVRVWDLHSGTVRHVLRGHTDWVTALTFSADERFAVTGSHDRTVRLWDLADGRCARTIRAHTADTLALSPDMRFLLSGDAFDGTVRFWDLQSGRCLRTFAGHRNGTAAVLFEPSARAGLSTGHDRTVRRWRLPAHYSAAFHVSRPRSPGQLSRTGSRVAALVADAEQAMAQGRFPAALDLLSEARSAPGHERDPRVMAVWRRLRACCVRTRLRGAWSSRTLIGHVGTVNTVDISRDGRIAASGGEDGTVRVWSVDSGDCTRVFGDHGKSVGWVCLGPDGTRLLSSGRDGTIRLWDLETGACLRVLKTGGPAHSAVPVRFAAGGRQAVVADPTGELRIWDLADGSLVRTMRTSTGRELSVAADGRLAAYARGDRVQLWDLHTGDCVRFLRLELAYGMDTVSLSADGRLVLTGERSGIRLWDAASGNLVRTFSDDDPLAYRPSRNERVRMTADGRFAVSGGHSSFAAVWDLATGERVRDLDGHEHGVCGLAMTPDGGRVLAGIGSGALRLWELDWEPAARDAADWDDGAAPYLEVFLRRFGPQWTDGDLRFLHGLLQDVGYGWLRHGGVRAKLESLTAAKAPQRERPQQAQARPADEDRVLLIGFHPEDGRVIVARNNADLARYAVVLIPGVGAGTQRLEALLQGAESFYGQLAVLTKERVSVVTWLDYVAPQTPQEARDKVFAERGAAALAEFIAGMRATSQLDALTGRARITVIGHGYGGLVAGIAARDHGLDADALVFLGSASAGVGTAAALRVPGPIYATSPDVNGDGTPQGIHGPRPDSPEFGARTLRPVPRPRGDDPTVPYLFSLARIVLGDV